MKKNTLLLIVFLIIYLNIFAQKHKQISFIAYWNLGDTYTYQITKVKLKQKNNIPTENNIRTYKATFEVIDSTNSEYTIKWTLDNFSTNELNIPVEILEKTSQYSLNEVIYKTTETGVFIEIVNWQEIAEYMNASFNSIIQYFVTEKGISKESFEKSLYPLMNTFTSKEGIEQVLLKEIILFHTPMGYMYDTNKKIKYKDLLPNVFGGPHLNANGVMFFKNIDTSYSRCTIINELEINNNDAKKFLKDFMLRIGINELEVNKSIKKSSLKIKDRKTLDYFYYPGIPNKIEYKRETIFKVIDDSFYNMENMTIELIK